MRNKILVIFTCIILIMGCFMNACAKKPNSPGNSDGGTSDELPEKNFEEQLTLKSFSNPATIYVDQGKGTDTNDGKSREAAVKTIGKAVELASGIHSADIDAIKVAIIGQYTADTTICIKERFGENCPLVITSADEEMSVISGAEMFSGGWTEYKDGIYKKNIGADKSFRQLYINSEIGIRSRYPNVDKNPQACIMSGTFLDAEKRLEAPWEMSYGFDVSAFKPGTMEVFMLEEWTQGIAQIVSISEGDYGYEMEFTPEHAEYFFKNRSGKMMKPRIWVENDLSLLDDVNEWFYDSVTGELYYKPQSNTDIQSLVFKIPVQEKIISIEGTEGSYASNIIFDRIAVTGSNWAKATELKGLSSGQGNSINDGTMPPAAIDLKRAENIRFQNCEISDMGAVGVNVSVCNGIYFKANNIHTIAADAVRFGTFAKNQAVVKNIWFEDNYIHEIGTGYMGSVGIFGGYSEDVFIYNNEITDVTYSGISLGWGWGIASTMHNFIIKYNRIYNTVNNLLFDGAEIYLLGAHTKDGEISEVSENYIDCGQGLAGLYFDEGSSYWKAEKNVIVGSGQVGFLHIHDVDYILRELYVSNTFTTTKKYSLRSWSPSGKAEISVKDRNIKITNTVTKSVNEEWSEEAQKVIGAAGVRKYYKAVNHW